jgi:hypothetical protein
MADLAPQLRAAIAGVRISEPARVAGVLAELRIESVGHLGRLDLEERSELMATMRGAGVALGDRNKLRLLASGPETAMMSPGHEGSRRTQAEEPEITRQADFRRDSTTTQARERASEQGDGTKQESSRILGVSGDSASS